MANRDQKNRTANNKPKLSVKEKERAQGEKGCCESATVSASANPRTPLSGRGGSGNSGWAPTIPRRAMEVAERLAMLFSTQGIGVLPISDEECKYLVHLHIEGVRPLLGNQ